MLILAAQTIPFFMTSYSYLVRLSAAMQGRKKELAERLPEIPYSTIIDVFRNERAVRIKNDGTPWSRSRHHDRERIFAEAEKMLAEMGINLKKN
jgi:hypothetical protein